MQQCLAHWCADSTAVTAPYAFYQVKNDIDQGHPLIVAWAGTTGLGHFVVVRGYTVDSSGTKWLHLMDPDTSYGFRKMRYDAVKSSPGRTWVQTLAAISAATSVGDWKVTNSTPVRRTYAGKKYWALRLYLDEISGGCGELQRWFVDFYNTYGVLLGHFDRTLTDFLLGMDDCAPPLYELSNLTRFCGDRAVYKTTEGYVQYGFVIRGDNGTLAKVLSPMTYLPKYSPEAIPAEGSDMQEGPEEQ